MEVNMADADLILESQPPFYFDIIGRRSGHNGGLSDISMHGDQFDSKSSHVTTKPVKFHWFCFKGHPGVSLSFHNFHTLNILNEVENFVYIFWCLAQTINISDDFVCCIRFFCKNIVLTFKIPIVGTLYHRYAMYIFGGYEGGWRALWSKEG